MRVVGPLLMVGLAEEAVRTYGGPLIDTIRCLCLTNEPCCLEHIPSPFSNLRNVVIKQPAGNYSSPASW
jgi:hypothetical protein